MAEEKHECPGVTDEVAEDIIKRLNIPESVSVVHAHETSLSLLLFKLMIIELIK